MRGRLLISIAGVIAVAAIVVGVNMFADARLAGVHVDLTENHIYTLSSGTRKILNGLKQPITLSLFYSRQLGAAAPTYGEYADRVREMLREYAAASHGMIRLKFYNPQPFSRVEDQALADGLQGVPIDQDGTKVYFGLAGSNMLDNDRTIPFFQPDRERFLEYDLSKLVYELSSPKRPVVGIMSSLPLDGDARLMMMTHGQEGMQPWASTLLIQQTNKTKTIPTNAQVIPKDVQVLLVAGAQHLSPDTQYAIDQFVMRGGRLMVMVDPWSEALAAEPTRSGMPPSDTHSNLKKLFKAWGIEFNPNEVVGDLDGAWQVRTSSSPTSGVTDYVPWFNIGKNGINHNDPATANLQQVTVASAGFIQKAPHAKIQFTPLLTATGRDGVIPVSEVKMPNPAKVLAGFKPDGKPRVIAARIRGELKSAFSGPPPLAKGQKRPKDFPPYLAHTKGPADLVVVADSDIMANRFWVHMTDFFGQKTAVPFSDDGPFVANLIDTLTGSDALISLRSRGDDNHPFTLVNRMQEQAEAKFRRTEEALKAHLTKVEQKLKTLRQGKSNGPEAASMQAVITPQQQQEIDAARKDIVDTREQLRAVERDLNRNISHLEAELRVFDIVLVPALLTLLALGLGLVRRQRRSRARA